MIVGVGKFFIFSSGTEDQACSLSAKRRGVTARRAQSGSTREDISSQACHSFCELRIGRNAFFYHCTMYCEGERGVVDIFSEQRPMQLLRVLVTSPGGFSYSSLPVIPAIMMTPCGSHRKDNTGNNYIMNKKRGGERGLLW